MGLSTDRFRHEGWLAIAPAVTSTFFGLRNLGSNYGVVFTAYGTGAIVGPLASSYIYASTHSYTSALPTTAIFALVRMGVAFQTYGPPRLVAAVAK